jgi:transposase InsO family protein
LYDEVMVVLFDQVEQPEPGRLWLCWSLEIVLQQSRRNVEREQLTQIIREEALKHPTYGYRRIRWRLNTKRGISVHASRVYRLWRKEGLSLKRVKKRRKRTGQGEQPPPRALYPNHVWTYDFVKLRLYNWKWQAKNEPVRH